MKKIDIKEKYYDLHIIKTEKFKTVRMKVDLRTNAQRETNAYMSLLQNILTVSTKYKSLKERNIICADLYDPMWSIRSVDSGSKKCLSLAATFTNEKYTEKGMNEKTIKYVLDFLFNPKTVDNHFDKEIFENEKTNCLEYLKSLKDNPDAYSNYRLMGNMQIYDFKPLTIEDYIKQTEEITEESLYRFYQNLLKNSKMDIFISGDIDENQIKEILEKLIKRNSNIETLTSHYIDQKEYNESPKIIKEKTNNTQSKLAMGLKAVNLTETEKKYTLLLYSWILGRGTNSLLFDDVREKHSLCYYIYSNAKPLEGIINIYAGIDCDKFEKVHELIKENMKKIEEGNFSDEKIKSVKNTYNNSLINIEDSLISITENLESQIFIKSDDLETRKTEIEKITKKDIQNVAKKVHIDTIFLLEGGQNGA